MDEREREQKSKKSFVRDGSNVFALRTVGNI